MLMNKIDTECPEVLYLLPENFVEIPFEVFRAFKRGQHALYETEEDKSLKEIQRDIQFKYIESCLN
jgi:hypothetical protein